jgi:hypothetical protein
LLRFYKGTVEGREAAREWDIQHWTDADWDKKCEVIMTYYKKKAAKAAKKGVIGPDADYQALMFLGINSKYNIDPRKLPPLPTAMTDKDVQKIEAARIAAEMRVKLAAEQQQQRQQQLAIPVEVAESVEVQPAAVAAAVAPALAAAASTTQRVVGTPTVLGESVEITGTAPGPADARQRNDAWQRASTTAGSLSRSMDGDIPDRTDKIPSMMIAVRPRSL